MRGIADHSGVRLRENNPTLEPWNVEVDVLIWTACGFRLFSMRRTRLSWTL